jgi:hypothetical protein
VRIALLPTLVAVGWISLAANVPAQAQNGPVAPAGVPAAMPATAPAAPPDLTTNGPLLMDNGLWDGASVGPCCAMCGGGSGCPADWYTLQGTRIISRNNLRKIPISFQTPNVISPNIAAPPPDNTGPYRAVQISDNPVAFRVLNTDVTTANSVLTNSGTVANPFQVLNAKQFGLDVAAGYNFTLGHYFCHDRNNNDHFVEFTFWGLNSWHSSKVINGYLIPIYDENVTYNSSEGAAINSGQLLPLQVLPQVLVGSLRTPFPTPRDFPAATDQQKTLSIAFNNGIEQDFSYRSTMNNFELNGRINPRGEPDRLVLHPDGRWQRQCQPGTFMSYLYGIRFMQVDETFTFHSLGQGQFGEDVTLPAQNAAGDYDIVTHNDLLGIQIGADMTFRHCRWAWGVESKAGTYINFANQISTINANVVNGLSRPAYDQRLVANRYEAAFIGEVGFQATYKFRPNLMGRAAYDFMWVTGVALAPEQLQLVANPVNRLNVNGTIFSQCLSLGLEWMW